MPFLDERVRHFRDLGYLSEQAAREVVNGTYQEIAPFPRMRTAATLVALTGMVAHSGCFGGNSTWYQQVGGTSKAEHKRPKRAAKFPAPMAPNVTEN